jgi:carbamoyl-phosphate synthase large subunit
MNILLTSVAGKIVTADLKKSAPASFLADVAELVPRVSDPTYIDRLLEICRQHSIDLLVPLIDTELHLLSLHRHQFAEIGTRLLISAAETNDICYSKQKTGEFFKKIGVITPKVYQLDEITDANFPLILKPDTGSSSIGLHYVKTRKELDFLANYVEGAIFQELIQGEEYTIDTLLDFNGKAISIVPRLRLETRAGEISKGITTKNPRLIAAAKYVAESLPGAIGCITLQCFLRPNGEIVFIEINPRFGGGYPLSYRAGADFPNWLFQLCRGEYPRVAIDEWEDDLAMLRYDDAIFVKASELIVRAKEPELAC